MATSGSPAGASGMNALPSAESSIAPMATGPMPQRRVARAATTAPMNDETPPTPATRPSTAGPSCSSSRTKRNQVAPKMPHSAASAICAPAKARRTGSWRTSRRPSRISARTGSRSSAGGGGGSSCRIVAEEDRRDEEGTASMAIGDRARSAPGRGSR